MLELGTLIAGPFAGRLLADFGAEVIKVEHPGQGDPLRSWGETLERQDSLWHLVQSRGKRSVAADLHDPADQALVRALAARERHPHRELPAGPPRGMGPRPGGPDGREPAARSSSGSRATARPVRCATSPASGRSPRRPAGCATSPASRTDRPLASASAWATRSPRCTRSSARSSPSTSARRRAAARSWTSRSPRPCSACSKASFPSTATRALVRERVGNIAHNSAPTNAYPCADGDRSCASPPTRRGCSERCSGPSAETTIADDRALGTNQGRVRRADELDDGDRRVDERRGRPRRSSPSSASGASR